MMRSDYSRSGQRVAPRQLIHSPVEEPPVVLLYDADPNVAPLIRFLLEYLGCTVRTAATVADAAAIAQEQAPALAVVRPDTATESWAVCRQIQAHLEAPVIGLVPPDVAGEPSADLYLLPLPLVPSTLRELVTSLLAGVAP
jgi:hypothetical protein